MTFSVALYACTSGMSANQEAMTVAAANIANANNPNHSKLVANQETVVLNGAVEGVTIGSITRNVDNNVVNTLRNENSALSYANSLSTYYTNIQTLFGQPNPYTSPTLTNMMDNFFSALQNLAISPSLLSTQSAAVNQAHLVATNVSSLAQQLQALRASADNDINNSIGTINSLLTAIGETNASIVDLNSNYSDVTGLQENLDMLLGQLSAQINISVSQNGNGSVTVSTANGIALVDGSFIYNVSYAPAGTIQAFINNVSMAPITVAPKTSSMDTALSTATLVTGGTAEQGGTPSTITTALTQGNLKAYLDMRDKIIPEILDELDNFVYTFTKEFNTIHNSGSGYPPKSELTGTRPVFNTDVHNWTGSARIATINANGQPLTKADNTPMLPLTLDFDTLRNANTAGQLDVQTLIKELNQYFYYDQVENRTALGNLYDIKMAATSNLVTSPSPQFSFDFQLTNNDQLNSTFNVLNVQVQGCAGCSVSTLPSSFNINAGTRARTYSPTTITFPMGSSGSYTIQVEMEVIDANGNASVSVVNFPVTIDPTSPNIENTRYTASSIASGSASIVASGTNQGFALASLVDSNGNTVTGNTSSGFLQIKTLNSAYSLAIDDMTSSEAGTVIGTQTIDPSNLGFSGYFKLNDFFVGNPNYIPGTSDSAVTNSALNFAVRSDILANPYLMSLGQLTLSPSYQQLQTQGLTKASGTLQFVGNPSINDTITINGQVFTFVNSATSSNQITLGATLSQTLTNIVNTLKVTNSYTAGTVDNATYSSDGASTITILYNAAGSNGNSFSLATNLASATANINSGTSSHSPSGFLNGGSSQEALATIQPWTYQIGQSSNQIITKLAQLRSASLQFSAAGNLSGVTVTATNYAGFIIGDITNQIVGNNTQLQQQQTVYDTVNQTMLSTSGVNIDNELASVILNQQVYSASANTAYVIRECLKELFGILRA